MKTIKNFELKVKRVAVGEGTEPTARGATVSPCAARGGRLARLAQTGVKSGDCAQGALPGLPSSTSGIAVIGFSEVARGGIDSCQLTPE